MKNYMLIKVNADGSTTIMSEGLCSIDDCARVWNERIAFGGRGLIADGSGNIVATIGD